MALILTENFEAAGYDAAGWTESVGVGSTVNEDAATTLPNSPPGWGSQCLQIIKAASVDAYSFNALASPVISYSAFEVVITAVSPTLGNNLVLGLDAGGTLVLWGLFFSPDGGVQTLQFVVVPGALGGAGGPSLIPWSAKLNLGQVYHFEVKWDTTNDQWGLWVDGVFIDGGSLTGTAATTPLTLYLFGDLASDPGTFTAYFDLVRVDNANFIGPLIEKNRRVSTRRIRDSMMDSEDEGHFNELDVKNWW